MPPARYPLRILTYNVLYGGTGRETALAAVITSQNADIILLQEVSTGPFVADLARSLAMTCVVAPVRSRFGTAILTRYPVMSSSIHGRGAVAVADVAAAAGKGSSMPVRVVAVHAAPFPNVLLEWYRARQVSTALACAGQPGVVGSVIAGDLNAFAPGDPLRLEEFPWYLKAMMLAQGNRIPRLAIARLVRAGFVDCFRAAHPDMPGYTVPAPAPNARIDYIFASPLLASRCVDCFVPNGPAAIDTASDHYPVVSQFDI